MMLWQVARDLTRRLPESETPAKVSLAIALPLLIMLLGMGFFGPESLQLPARIGAFGLLDHDSTAVPLEPIGGMPRPIIRRSSTSSQGTTKPRAICSRPCLNVGAPQLTRWFCSATPIVIWVTSAWLKRR